MRPSAMSRSSAFPVLGGGPSSATGLEGIHCRTWRPALGLPGEPSRNSLDRGDGLQASACFALDQDGEQWSYT
jgi:hypothetical protein